VSTMMLDHPAWLLSEDGRARRAFRSGDAIWTVVCASSDTTAEPAIQVGRCGDVADVGPVIDVVDPATLSAPDVIKKPLCAGGSVRRVRNPDIWDALATVVIRQVIQAGQARKMYRTFCEAHGDEVETTAGPALLLPQPETVLGLADGAFADLGMAFKRRPLRAAAEAYLKYGNEWTACTPAELVTELQTVFRVGPWSAGAAVADITNDYSLYPFADLAVRRWVTEFAPSVGWPTEEPRFANVWQELAGEQLSLWTLLTLAWGVRHANGAAI
jgi:DNA-3-methyladenine glycosylase II